VKRAGLGLLAGLALLACKKEPPPVPVVAAVTAQLRDVGPRLISNETAYPVFLYGDGFTAGLTLQLGGGVAVPTVMLDAQHLTAVIPPDGAMPPGLHEKSVELTLRKADGTVLPGRVKLAVANDAHYPKPVNLAVTPDGRHVLVPVQQLDVLWVFARPGGTVQSIPMADGPTGVGVWVDPQGVTWAVVAHEYSPTLRLVRPDAPEVAAVDIPVTGNASDVLVDGKTHRAYVGNHRINAVEVVDLVARKVVGRLPSGVHPRAMVLSPDGSSLVVANTGSEDLSVVDVAKAAEARVIPKPGMPIVGGHTEKLSAFIMGGKRTRGLAWSRSGMVFASGMGPNLGPNPAREEVTMNGGVSVVDPKAGKVLRHVSMGGGLGDGVALDEARGLLFVASVSTGQVMVLDARALASDDAKAAKALLGKVEILPPADVPLFRPAEDFGVNGRAGVAAHSGPRALALVDGGKVLLVLNRLTRTISEVDVQKANKGVMTVARTHRAPTGVTQKDRWLGEMVYYSDIGNTGMSCDACHPDGTTGGVLFTKGSPMQIYRSSHMRGIRESAPYFTPQRTPSLMTTSTFVLARNRFQNPEPAKTEIHGLSIFTGLFVVPPNPYVGAHGEPPPTLELPDGKTGRPKQGLILFEGKGCSTKECHPGPHMSGDQDPSTRGKFLDVGSGQFLPLRPAMQDAREGTWPPAPLLGAWDLFPLFNSGSAGYGVAEDGTLKVTHSFALRAVMEHPGAARHGAIKTLTPTEQNDLLAYLMTL